RPGHIQATIMPVPRGPFHTVACAPGHTGAGRVSGRPARSGAAADGPGDRGSGDDAAAEHDMAPLPQGPVVLARVARDHEQVRRRAVLEPRRAEEASWCPGRGVEDLGAAEPCPVQLIELVMDDAVV